MLCSALVKELMSDSLASSVPKTKASYHYHLRKSLYAVMQANDMQDEPVFKVHLPWRQGLVNLGDGSH